MWPPKVGPANPPSEKSEVLGKGSDFLEKIRQVGWFEWLNARPPGGHTEIVRLLIHANGDLERKDNAGLTPTNHAELHGHTQVVCLLRELRGWPKRQRSEGEMDQS